METGDPGDFVRLLTLHFWRLTSKEEISGLINYLIYLISQSHQALIWCVGTSDSSAMGTKAAKTVEEQDCPGEDYQGED